MELDVLRSKAAIMKDATFRTFFIGVSVSKMGDGLIPVAFALAAYQTVGSGYGITLVLLSLWTTRFITVPLGGRVADTHNRLFVALSADVVRLLAQGGLAVAIIFSPSINLWYLCVSAALYGVGTGFYIQRKSASCRSLFHTSDCATPTQ
jgi:MFS family permease